jgi:hypothetical protein
VVEDEVRIDEELGIGARLEEDTGGEPPSQVPKADRQPVPQY